jgi:hypothetical protein
VGKTMGTVALFLGAFLLALAALSKFYMYDQLAVVPYNHTATTISDTAPGDDAVYLDAAAGLTITTGPLKNTKVVTGDVKASKKASKELDKDITVWDIYDCTDTPDFDCGGGETALSAVYDRVAFDRNTGLAVDYPDTFSDAGTKIEPGDFEGLYFKFPFDTKKKTYQFWDGTLHKATPATYVGEGKVKGMKVYKFEQVIDPVKIDTLDVPGSLVGSDEATVSADQIYSNVRTFSVEPVTGVIIIGAEAQDNYLEVDGVRKTTTTDATLTYNDDTIQDNVDEFKTKALLLTAVKTWVPIGGTVIGLLLIAAGLWTRRGRDGGVHAADQDELVGSH